VLAYDVLDDCCGMQKGSGSSMCRRAKRLSPPRGARATSTDRCRQTSDPSLTWNLREPSNVQCQQLHHFHYQLQGIIMGKLNMMISSASVVTPSGPRNPTRKWVERRAAVFCQQASTKRFAILQNARPRNAILTRYSRMLLYRAWSTGCCHV
jgi:hypothetical protein